ncbi:interferon-induced helicase C domain-containing protein 1 isoform X2 [Dendropsophus ebraccatus]|uniref:interferon-induced helicase C domain-containing protein 1 isoform X2 n=1 Tax=Dendropsophus ebraccatus TaxID=150705 RepID=UPI0038320990
MQQDNSDEIHRNTIVAFKPRLCSLIQVIPVLENMHSLNQEFKEELQAKVATAGNLAGARALLDHIISGPRWLGWFSEFVTALRKAENTQAEMYLAESLPAPQEEVKYDTCVQLVQLLSFQLLEKLDPKETTEKCFSAEICSLEDVDVINAKQGNYEANRELLSRITKKKDWYKVFFRVLHELEKKDLIKELTGGTYEEFIDGMNEVDDVLANHKSSSLDDCVSSEMTEQHNSHDVTGANGYLDISYSEASSHSDLDANFTKSPENHDCCEESDTDASFTKSTENHDCCRESEYDDESTSQDRASPVPIMTLRDYQMEVARPALDGENIIICLPTGSGKTRVAVYIARNHLDKRRKKGLPAKVIVLVNKVPLVDQHYRTEFHPYMKDRYRVNKISGDSKLKISFHREVMESDVMICTAQILENSLLRAEEDEEEGVQLSDFSLLIIDECHHTQKGSVYNSIMIRYLQQKRENKKLLKLQEPLVPLPQILGLTASPGVGGAKEKKKAEEHILKICANLDSKIKTVQEHKAQLDNQVKHPDKRVETAEDNDKSPFGDKIKDMMKTIEAFSVLYPPNEYGSQSYEQWAVQTEKSAAKEGNRKQHVCAQHLKKYNDALQIYDTIRMNDALSHLEKFYNEERKRAFMLNESGGASLSEKIDETDRFLTNLFFEQKKELKKLAEKEEYENDQLAKLRRSIMEQFTRNNEARGIVFTRTRQSAVALCQWIDENEKFKEVGIQAHYIIGAGSNSDYKSMTQNEQKKVIHKFSTGELNLLIATSVAEEGLDIKECNIVILYGLTTNEIAMMQARGRARAAESVFIVVASRSSGVADHDSVNVFRENMMYKAIQKVQEMDPKLYSKKMEEFQKQTIAERKVKKKKDLLKVYQENPSKVTFLCAKCQRLVCSGVDIQVIEDMHHVVPDAKFKNLYKKGENKNLQEKYAGYQTNGEIICNKCARPWGKIMVYKGVELPCLNICNFVIRYENEPLTNDMLDAWRDLRIRFPPFSYLSDDSDDD